MEIRPTRASDWEALKALRLAALQAAPTAFGVSYASAAADSDQRWRQRATADTQPEYWLALAQGQAVGMIGGAPDAQGHYHLIAMYVMPEFRGQGAAAGLVAAVTARAAALGYRQVNLDVAPDNAAAVALYQRQGFVFLPHWEALASHPHIQVQRMAWQPA
jgi:ribosomal protein S18 acetylase RimI-like enzyme